MKQQLLAVALLAGVSVSVGSPPAPGVTLVQKVRENLSRSVGLVLVSYEIHEESGNVMTSGLISGTGFYIEGGWVASNRHVLAPWYSKDLERVAIDAGGKLVFLELVFVVDNKVVRMDPDSIRWARESDVAAAKPLDEVLSPQLRLRRDGTEGEGTKAVVCGFPMGLKPVLARLPEKVRALVPFWYSRLSQVTLVAKWGMVTPHVTSGVIGIDTEYWVITDAVAYFGNSGGPCFGDDGLVIGLVTGIMDHHYHGHNFVLPVTRLLDLISG